MTIKSLTIAAAFAACATPAMAESLWDKIERTGEVVCGGIQNYKPTSFYTGSDLVYEGYGPNVCRQIVADLSTAMGKPLEVKWRETTWSGIVLDLQAGKIDIFPGMSATEERRKALDMPGPLYRLTDCVIAGKHVETFDTWEAYNKPEVTFGMVTGTAHVKFLKDEVPNAKIMAVKEMNETVMAVQAKRADYLLQELPICLTTYTASKDSFSGFAVPQPARGSDSVAGLRRDGDGRLKDFIQKWSEEKRADGSIAPLLLEGFKAAGLDVSEIPAGMEF